MPDYGGIELRAVAHDQLGGLPDWAPPVTLRRGITLCGNPVTLVGFEGLARPHPYADPRTGHGWADNDTRFAVFSLAVARLAVESGPDVVHLNDWHTAAATAFLPADIPSVLTIHNLAHQGSAAAHWIDSFGQHGLAFLENTEYNALAGGISLADRVVLVSESFATEAMNDGGGFGLHHRLASRGEAVSGIRNGIDLGLWHPEEDPHIPFSFSYGDLVGKEICRKELLREADLELDRGPVIGLVARFVHQKGIDLALELAPYLDRLPAALVMMGSGNLDLMRSARAVARRHPDRVHVFEGYDEDLAHLLVAGSDLLLVPSRFEPCGLTQMQAMTCGTIPVVTDVGGLRDTVVDADVNSRAGTGFVAAEPTALAVLDAIHRATRCWSNSRRRDTLQRHGMTADWSWADPAQRYLEIYRAA